MTWKKSVYFDPASQVGMVKNSGEVKKLSLSHEYT